MTDAKLVSLILKNHPNLTLLKDSKGKPWKIVEKGGKLDDGNN